MSRPALDNACDDAKAGVDWLYKQAEDYERLCPALRKDIEQFRNLAALLDTYQAGLVPVTPHPITRSELVQWISVEDHQPDDETTVLIFSAGDPLGEPWPGYRNAGQWFAADGMPLGQNVTHWADMPVGPAQVKTQSSTGELAA